MICDVCNASVSDGRGRQLPAAEFHKWLSSGFEPDEATLSMLLETGGDRMSAIQAWAAQCASFSSDWLLCDQCVTRAPAGVKQQSPEGVPKLLKNSLKEKCLSGQGKWIIQFMGADANEQTVLGLGWQADWDLNADVTPLTFSKETGGRLIQLLHSAFVALHDPSSYFSQIDPAGLMPDADREDYVVVGSVKESGALQIVARWDTTPHFAEVMLYLPDGSRGPVALLEKGSIARITLTIEEIFEQLGWPNPVR